MSIGTESQVALVAELSALIDRGTAVLVSGQRLAGPAAAQESPAELIPDPVNGSVGIGLIYADDVVVAAALTKPLALELAGSLEPEALQGALGDLLAAFASGRNVEVTGLVSLESDADLIEFLGQRPGLVGAGLFDGDAIAATFGAAGPAPTAAHEPPAAPVAPTVVAQQAPAPEPAVVHETPPTAPEAPAATAPAPAPIAAQPAGTDRLARGLAMLADVHLEVTAELGRTKLRVSELLSLEPGSVIGLEREAGSPVDLLVNGTLFARAEVIVVENQYAVRITELVGGGVPA